MPFAEQTCVIDSYVSRDLEAAFLRIRRLLEDEVAARLVETEQVTSLQTRRQAEIELDSFQVSQILRIERRAREGTKGGRSGYWQAGAFGMSKKRACLGLKKVADELLEVEKRKEGGLVQEKARKRGDQFAGFLKNVTGCCQIRRCQWVKTKHD